MTRDQYKAAGIGIGRTGWRDGMVVWGPVGVLVVAAILFTVKVFHPAPPNHIRMIGGAAGSSYQVTAEKYKKIIEAHGVRVEIVASEGALDNLRRLADPRSNIDVGFVQGGLADGIDTSRLVSLGTIFTQPLVVYYRGDKTIDRLTDLRGKRVCIGVEGSGTHALALKLLKANEMDASSLTLVFEHDAAGARSLIAGRIDAAFIMGDAATPQILRELRDAPGVRIMSFRQAGAYVRKLRFLSRLSLPEGTFDLGKNHPPEDVALVGPAVELVAHNNLHPALSDLLIAAARQIHGGAGTFRLAGEYPSPVEHDFPISTDAERYYKSGGQFLYKALPFWLASLLDRLLVIVLPLLVVVVPATRLAPQIYRWRVRSRIYRFYGVLIAIEREIPQAVTPESRVAIRHRLDEIEHAVNAIRTPLAFADQLFVLRDHVAGVRRRLDEHPPQSKASAG